MRVDCEDEPMPQLLRHYDSAEAKALSVCFKHCAFAMVGEYGVGRMNVVANDFQMLMPTNFLYFKIYLFDIILFYSLIIKLNTTARLYFIVNFPYSNLMLPRRHITS